MPTLTVRLFGTLHRAVERYDPSLGITITVPHGTTVEDLIHMLNLEAKQVGMVSLNGSLVASDQELYDGAELKLFQPIAGG